MRQQPFVIARKLGLILTTLALTFTSSAHGETISTFPIGGGAFGGAPGGDDFMRYVAQTFVALPGLADSATFAFNNGSTGPVRFNVLVTGTSGDVDLGDTVGSFHPTNILFTSNVFTLPAGSSDTVMTVGLGGLALTPGTYYALVFDPWVQRGTGPVAGGHFGSIGTPGGMFVEESYAGTDADQLNGQWYNVHNDMSFSVNFAPVTAPVPEPEIYAMMLSGLGLLGFVARRRRHKAGA